MYIDTSSLTNKEMYKFLIGGVAPRPIAWAGTRSKEGLNNLAPFSFYNAFSSTPPIVGFSTIPRVDGRKKTPCRMCWIPSASHLTASATN